jgi:cell division protein ZipA
MDIAPDIPPDDVDEMVLLRGELPNGGARVVRDGSSPEQGSLNLETSAPLLMEPSDSFELEAREDAKVEPTNPAQVEERFNADVMLAHRLEPPHREPTAVSDLSASQDVLVISVLSRSEDRFLGSDLLEVFVRNGLKFGDMNIFHRLDSTTKSVQFSIADALEPGTFDLSEMDALNTPGVTIFMQMPGPEDPGVAFDDMLSVARDIGQALGGELKDENLSVMTGQTIEHFRQRIAEFSRKQMSLRA